MIIAVGLVNTDNARFGTVWIRNCPNGEIDVTPFLPIGGEGAREAFSDEDGERQIWDIEDDRFGDPGDVWNQHHTADYRRGKW